MDKAIKIRKDGAEKLSRGDHIFLGINNFLLIIVTIICLYPLIFVLSASFSDPMEVAAGRMWLWPVGIDLEGYERVFANSKIMRGYLNTIIYTVLGTLWQITFTVMAAYPLSRKMAGRRIITFYFVFTMYFGGGMIPYYLLIKSLGIINTFWVMLLPMGASTYNILVMRTFFKTTIPEELYEAARIDGCSHIHSLFKITLPLSGAILAVMALWYGIGHWNSYFHAFIYLNDQRLYPLQLVVRQIVVVGDLSDITQTGYVDPEMKIRLQLLANTIKYSIIVVTSAPLLIAYPFLQKYFVKGVMIGAVKG